MILSSYRDIHKCLVSFLKYSTRITEKRGYRNPSWLFCLPIIHFLDGSLRPFEELDFANFQDKKNDWWITNVFEKEKEELKRCSWSRYLALEISQAIGDLYNIINYLLSDKK